MENPNLEPSVLESISKDRAVRQAVTRESHLMFFHVYFSRHVKYGIAEFQKEIFHVTEDRPNKLACIVAFRGSGKSTLVSSSYSIWAVLGVQQKKFVLIICQTQGQARMQMANIKDELEKNNLLRSDLGPFREDGGTEQWAMSSLVFQNTGARIMVASVEQSIRGIRHHEHRPDLIILDDVEDIQSTKTMEGRTKLFDWFTREIVPLGDIGTRIIIVGNLLHDDSLVMRLRRRIEKGEIKGIYRWFPLLEDGVCLWPSKFDTPEKIEELRMSVANDLAWRQEYLLEIVSDHTRVIHPEWIHYYDELPPYKYPYQAFIGMDLAISEAKTADCTAMVTIFTRGSGSKTKCFVLPRPVNVRLSFPAVVETAIVLRETFRSENCETPKFVVESNGFQQIYVEALAETGCEVEGVRHGADKRTRLALISRMLEQGIVSFPKEGCEELIMQLTGFGSERHDDLADAFAMAVMKIMEFIDGSRAMESYIDFLKENDGPWI